MASLRQVVEQLALIAAGTNSTSGSPDFSSAMSAPRGPFDTLTATLKLLFSASALRDWAILLVIGSLFETARRLLASLWYWLINSFYITAVFDEDDISFQWIMHWLSKQPSWNGARNVQISTSNFDLHAMQMGSDDSDVYSRKVRYLPAVSESYTFWCKYRWMKLARAIEARSGGQSTKETLTIRIMTRDRTVLTGILENAKNEYLEAQRNKISIFILDRYRFPNRWRELATRPKRPLNSIILDPGIIELVIEDVQDFLNSKEWYTERGIPFRRGYLLYGAPGSGKTSLIHSIAGELGLNVYIISLSRSGLDDTDLSQFISTLPERCIALMEDIDAAFHRSLSRESPHGSSTDEDDEHEIQQTSPFIPSGNRVSLSGLLNALDGIGAQEGRVLFATTNKYSSLDPALCRPGRMDLHIEFKLASRFQAEELFKRFYAPSSSASGGATGTCEKGRQEKEGNVDVGEEARPLLTGDLINLTEPRAPPNDSFSPQHPSNTSLSEKTDEDRDAPRPTYIGVTHRARAPSIPLATVQALAAQFARAIPERELSMASLQGFLMIYKGRPFGAVGAIGGWVEKELAERARRRAE